MEQPVLFFDIDNTLYAESTGIGLQMADRIELYCRERMGMSTEEAKTISKKYYMDYGLAIKGLLKHHDICPIDYDEFVDGGLKLDGVLKRNEELIDMIKRLKIRKWLFTNAGIFHATRVLKLLEIQDLFEGITYCNYSEKDFPCKPHKESFEKAMKDANVHDHKLCYLIDDSYSNIRTAVSLGWTGIHVVENGKNASGQEPHKLVVSNVLQLESLFPDLWNKKA